MHPKKHNEYKQITRVPRWPGDVYRCSLPLDAPFLIEFFFPFLGIFQGWGHEWLDLVMRWCLKKSIFIFKIFGFLGLAKNRKWGHGVRGYLRVCHSDASLCAENGDVTLERAGENAMGSCRFRNRHGGLLAVFEVVLTVDWWRWGYPPFGTASLWLVMPSFGRWGRR